MALITRSDVAGILVPSFTDVIFLSGINTQMFSNPFHILQTDVVILAQGVAYPVFGQQDAPQIRMVRVPDSKHVVDFALEPIRSRPDRDDAFDLFPFLDSCLYPNMLVPGKRVEGIDDLELL